MSTSLGWIVRPTQGSVVTLTRRIEHICMCVGQGAWLVDSLQGFYSAAEGWKTKWPLIPSPTLLSIVWIKTKMWNLWWRCCGTTTVAGGEDRQHRGLRNSLQKRREFEASSVDKYFLESWVMSLERTHLKNKQHCDKKVSGCKNAQKSIFQFSENCFSSKARSSGSITAPFTDITSIGWLYHLLKFNDFYLWTRSLWALRARLLVGGPSGRLLALRAC